MSDNPFHTSKLMRRIWTSAILSGLFAVVLGVAIPAWPAPSVNAAAVLLGVYLVVSGVALAFLAFTPPVSAGPKAP
jgi:uncharacterized membrane protein HdeD (DUF308 family)